MEQERVNELVFNVDEVLLHKKYFELLASEWKEGHFLMSGKQFIEYCSLILFRDNPQRVFNRSDYLQVCRTLASHPNFRKKSFFPSEKSRVT